MADKKPRSPGYLWRPGAAPEHNPLHLVVALVIALIVLGCVVAAIAA